MPDRATLPPRARLFEVKRSRLPLPLIPPLPLLLLLLPQLLLLLLSKVSKASACAAAASSWYRPRKGAA